MVFMNISFIKGKKTQQTKNTQTQTSNLKPSRLFRLPGIQLLLKQAIKHVTFGRKLVEITFKSCSEFHCN